MKRASLIGVLGLCAALIPAGGALAATSASSATSTAVYHGTAGHATRVAQASSLNGLHKVASRLKAATNGRVIPFRSPNGSYPAKASARTQAAKIAGGTSVVPYTSGSLANLVHHFNGVSDADSEALNGFPVTPPDQGLCVGYLNGIPGRVVFEINNLVARLTNVHGQALAPDFSLNTIFQDPFAEGDPRCFFDKATKAFYFTEIGFPPGGPNSTLTNTTLDVTVINAAGDVASYQFDTSLSGACLGDQPKTGYTNNSLIVSTDQFCGPTLSNYEGAIVLEISKSQLVNEASTVSDELFGPVGLGGILVTGLDPAINTRSGTAWFVNSFPFDAAGNNNAISSSLGLWKLKGDTLTGKLIHSESYAFPVPALSTGNGSVSGNITSEAALNPDDSRISGPVNVTRNSSGDTFLWTALDAGVAPKGDPTARDGAAWFKIDTGAGKVASQGYVAMKGAYLLYPAMQRQGGATEMVFTLTSPVINPSSAFTTVGSGTIKTVAAGAGPHLSFAEVLFNQSRWGDFSATAIDPGGNGVWMATEYIPPPAFQDPNDNWGTSVFEVSK